MSRLTHAELRLVASLRDKRDRDRLGLYVVEGDKLVREALLLKLDVERVYAETEWLAGLPEGALGVTRVFPVSSLELQRLSAQKTANRALAILRTPKFTYDGSAARAVPVLGLEAIQDPGNLGSLLRVATWFGIEDVVLSPDCADPFGPKAVQGSMGAIFRVRTHVFPLLPIAEEARRQGLPVVATALEGACVYQAQLEPRGLLLFGNESSGLSQEILSLATQRVSIPSWEASGPGRDSLNVAAAAAVICSELRRRPARADQVGQARERT